MADERDIRLVKNAVFALNNCTDTNATIDVFYNVICVLRLGKLIINNINSSILEWKDTCSFLATVLQENELSLQSISRLPGHPSKYYVKEEDLKMRRSAVAFETSLLTTNDYLTNIKEDASRHTFDSLENNIGEQEIVKFVSEMHTRVEELIHISDVESVQLACELINVYFKISILHSFVLWHILCIKLRSASDESSTKGVFSMVKNCQTSALNLLRCVTHPQVENAMFLTVFHITENNNVSHFLEIQDIEPYVFDKDFFAQSHYIQRVSSPYLKLHMVPLKFGIYGTSKTTEACKFHFEPVHGRELDNVCYIRSGRLEWEKYYIQMNSEGSCTAVENRPKSGGKWKCVPLVTGKEQQKFIISPIDFPGWFLYVGSITGSVCGQTDLQKVKKKGLWKICNI